MSRLICSRDLTIEGCAHTQKNSHACKSLARFTLNTDTVLRFLRYNARRPTQPGFIAPPRSSFPFRLCGICAGGQDTTFPQKSISARKTPTIVLVFPEGSREALTQFRKLARHCFHVAAAHHVGREQAEDDDGRSGDCSHQQAASL